MGRQFTHSYVHQIPENGMYIYTAVRRKQPVNAQGLKRISSGCSAFWIHSAMKNGSLAQHLKSTFFCIGISLAP